MSIMRGFGMAAAAMAFAVGPEPIKIDHPLRGPQRGQRRRAVPTAYSSPRSRTTLHATNGKRECARRRRQIAEGRLTESNGLVR